MLNYSVAELRFYNMNLAHFVKKYTYELFIVYFGS